MTQATAGEIRPRFPSGDILASGYLALLALATHASGFGPLGVAFFPLALLLAGFSPAAFLWITFAGFLLFFEAHLGASNAGPVNTPDLAAMAFFLHSLLSRNGFSYRLPLSPLLLFLYAFLAYSFALTVPTIQTHGPFDPWLLRDLKCLLYLALAALLCRHPGLGPKQLILLLLGTVLLTAGHAAFCLVQFALGGGRIFTWNEIFLADAVPLAVVLLAIPGLRRYRGALRVALVFSAIGLVLTQTRGVWLGTAAALIVYGVLQMAGADRARLRAMGRGLLVGFAILVVASLASRAAFNIDPVARIRDRFLQAGTPTEFIDPYASLGYRIHESLVVWEQRTWLGHGTGARLHLFFTQMGKSGMMDWWSIHSEYFEVLHKYGFVGLGLFLLLLGAMAVSAFRLAWSRQAVPSAMGYSVLLAVTNHAVASITSGYIIREHTAIYFAFLVVVLDRFGAARCAARTATTDGPAVPE
ncbi:MAG TPA: O-antigen ligase family protein [Fibrobacteria bacterium]|nr:O-antigen ligase family protein [Fibrobacteria bacterium]